MKNLEINRLKKIMCISERTENKGNFGSRRGYIVS